MWLFQILGSLGLVFRFWVLNFKIKDLLEHRIWHLSRILSALFFISMILEFKNNIFTLIVIGAFPTMVVAFLSFDVPFYNAIFRKDWVERLKINETGNFDKKFDNNNARFWIFMERITMHIPLIIVALYFYIEVGVKDFLLGGIQFMTLLIAFIFIMLCFLFVDPRWARKEENGKRNEWPSGLIILIGAIAESIFIVLYLYLDFSYLFN